MIKKVILSLIIDYRFGKIVWKESRGDQILDVNKLAEFASTIGSDGLMFFTEYVHYHNSVLSILSLNTVACRLTSDSPAALKNTCLRQIGYKDETYLFTLKARRSDESYRIRTRAVNGKPNIVYVRQLVGGSKRTQVLFDILCLHR